MRIGIIGTGDRGLASSRCITLFAMIEFGGHDDNVSTHERRSKIW